MATAHEMTTRGETLWTAESYARRHYLMRKPRLTDKRRKRGAQPGNRNAWKHGQRSAQAELDRKLSVARVRTLILLADALGMLEKKPRTLPLRDRERGLIFRHDPELAGALWLLVSC